MKKILNVLLGILMAITVVLMVYAMVSGGSNAAIGLNIIWGYCLIVFSIAAALFCAAFGMIKNPAGVKATALSLALVLVIVGVAYFVSAGHSIQITDLSSGGVFEQGETVLTETSVIVTYVAITAAFLAAIATEIWGAFK